MNCCTSPGNMLQATFSPRFRLDAANPIKAAFVKAPESYRSSMARWVLALFDQAMVSGTRFLTTILIGRAAGPEDLGHYSLAFTTFIFLGCVQEALVTTPFAVHCHRLRGRSRSAYAGSSLVMHAMLALLVALITSITAGITWSKVGDGELPKLMFLVAVCLPFSLMWEFTRRSMLAQLQITSVVKLDVTASATQILGLLALMLTHRLTSSTALMVIAASALVVAGGSLLRSRATRVVPWTKLKLYAQRNWRIGRWLVAAQTIGVVHGAVPSVLLALLAGASATGLYAAYLNFGLLANPMILAVVNLLTPRAAQALKTDGVAATTQLIAKAAFGMVAVLSCYVATLAIGGDAIVGLVYGEEYKGHMPVLILIGASTIAWSISMAYGAGLTAIKHPQGSFYATLTGTCFSAVVVLLTAGRWTVLGAASGLFIGSYIAAALHVYAFMRRQRELREGVEPRSFTMSKVPALNN